MDFGNSLVLSRGFESDNYIDTNNLINALMQYPEIADVFYLAYPQYSLSRITQAFINQPEQQISDWKFQYWIQGRQDRSITCTGTVNGTITPNNTGYIDFEENYPNPTETWLFESGTQLYIVDKPTPVGNGYRYPVKLVSSVATDTFDSSEAAVGVQLGQVGNINPEGSRNAYGNLVYPDLITNYLTTVRREYEVTGDAVTQKTWLKAGDEALWIPGTPEGFSSTFFGGRDSFMYMLERQSWFGKATVDANGNTPLYDLENKPIRSGNGFVHQIPSSMTTDYSLSSLTEDRLMNFIAQFKHECGVQKATIEAMAGVGFCLQFQKAMKNFAVTSHAGDRIVQRVGNNIQTGGNYYQYMSSDWTINLTENPILSDPVLHPTLEGRYGFPVKSFDAYFIENSMDDGIPTVQKLVRGKDRISRGMIFKLLAGMVDPMNPKSMQAVNTFDGYKYELLSQFMIAVRKPNRVAKMAWTGAY